MRERRAAYETKEPLEIATFETIYQMKPMERGGTIVFILTKDSPIYQVEDSNTSTGLTPPIQVRTHAVMMYGRIYDSEPENIYIIDIFRSKKTY